MCDAQCECDCTVRHVAACVVAEMCVEQCGIERKMMVVVCGGMDWCWA